jgi:RNA polymerase sigma-70 factor (ECF subfamily)
MRLRRHSFLVLSLDEMLEPGEKTAGQLQKHIGSRDLRLAGSADRMDLERALEQLPPGYKAVFILHDVQGYQHREIAAIRGCTLGNSKSQLHKARARLQHLLRAGVCDNERHVTEGTEPVLDVVSTF